MTLSPLQALSPLDGRYRSPLSVFSLYFSESALVKNRVYIEIEYLIHLSDSGIISLFTPEQVKNLQSIYTNFTDDDALIVKKHEKLINHDVKAVEYFLRDKFQKSNIPNDTYIHFGLTSEDVNNLAYSLALKTSLKELIIPQMTELIQTLARMSKQEAATVMLSRTHGQPAVPTTVGKELGLFAYRLHRHLKSLMTLEIEGKLNGAVGNFNAHAYAYPDYDWLKISKQFVQKLDLKPSLFSTQVLSCDSYVMVFQSLIHLNTILIGLVQDMWRYISDDYFLQKHDPSQVGSSTMPQKINPIDFENAEGNLGLANSMLQFLCAKLPISRLQRDLSDSTVKRNIGSALAYSYLGYASCLRGLLKISVNKPRLKEELLNHWEVVTEGVQTVLRTCNSPLAYEKLKEFSQGKHITKQSLTNFINTLPVEEEVKHKLKKITPLTYAGLAVKITKMMLRELKRL